MKNSDLKQTLKPLIKQCIKEVIFEDGVLSGIITEIVKGLGTDTRTMVTEAKETQPVKKSPENSERTTEIERIRREHRQQMENQRNSLSDAMGDRFGGLNLFEGVEPIGKAGSPSAGAAAPSSPLDGIDPNDPGVDIAKLGIFGKGR
jgi:hypothetical protein